MPQVRLLVGLAGIDFAHAAGELYSCDADSAARLVAAGFATWVETAAPVPARAVETAMRGVPERAVKPRAKGRG
jgi:hypothetical protein